MVVRERAVSPERFDRMLSVIELIEEKVKKVGETKFTKELSKRLKGLYAHSLSQAKVTLPR